MTDTERLVEIMLPSRRANRISAIGALLVMAAFALALWQLFRLDKEVSERKAELKAVNTQLTQVQSEKDRLSRDNQELRKQKSLLKRTNKDLEDTVRLQQNHDYNGALQKLVIILQKDPENEVAHCYAAHACYQLSRYSDAYAYAARSINIDPDYFDPYVPLVCALNKLGKHADAVKYLRTMLASRPENFTALVTRRRYFDDLWAVKDSRDAIVLHQQKLMAIQSALKELGYYNCDTCMVDALIGEGTLTAIQQFSAAQGITNRISVDALTQALKSAKSSRTLTRK